MRKDDSVHLLRILDEVSKAGNVTQRSLSRRLGMALGLTNLYVRRLGKKGLIKVVNLEANSLRYELTPQRHRAEDDHGVSVHSGILRVLPRGMEKPDEDV
jgi:DNA-binding MarR family transcriptional regulator